MDDTDYEAEVAILKQNSKELAEFVVTERPTQHCSGEEMSLGSGSRKVLDMRCCENNGVG